MNREAVNEFGNTRPTVPQLSAGHEGRLSGAARPSFEEDTALSYAKLTNPSAAGEVIHLNPLQGGALMIED
jgi:hypothetical protein